MTKSIKCAKCGGRMISKPVEIGTTETGLPYWGIYGVTPVAYVCNKCGYVELYDRERITRAKVKRKRVFSQA
jgi:predicted nucleic-acid-binding Zn-ribbon protein